MANPPAGRLLGQTRASREDKTPPPTVFTAHTPNFAQYKQPAEEQEPDGRLRVIQQTPSHQNEIAIPVAGSPGHQKHHLFGLPQELQDEIFDFAYPRVQRLKLVKTKGWEERQRKRQLLDSNYTVRPHPAEIVSAFLVSRRYFVAAARAWAGNQVIDMSTPSALGFSMFCSTSFMILRQFLTSLTTKHLGILNTLACYPRIKSLTIVITPFEFDAEFPELACRYPTSDADIHKIASELLPYGVKSLSKLEFVPGQTCGEAKTKEGKHIWAANVKKLQQALLVRLEESPRGEQSLRFRLFGDHQDDADPPLYEGSEVKLKSNESRSLPNDSKSFVCDLRTTTTKFQPANATKRKLEETNPHSDHDDERPVFTSTGNWCSRHPNKRMKTSSVVISNTCSGGKKGGYEDDLIAAFNQQMPALGKLSASARQGRPRAEAAVRSRAPKLTLEDLPNNLADFMRFVYTDGERLFDLVNRLKGDLSD